MAAIILFAKALGAGERWITIHPHGQGEKGQPVLVKPTPDGAFKVIGGAGGALSHLRLTGVKSEGDYGKEVGQRHAARREEKKRQKERDKDAGLTESKTAARETLKASLQQHQAKFVETVAKTMGWSQEEMRFPAEKFQNVSDVATKKALKKHGQELMQRARAAVDVQRRRLLNDAEARASAGLGEVPLITNDPTKLSVADLAPIAPDTKGFGYTTDYTARAEERGLSAGELQQEAAAARPVNSDGSATPGDKRRDAAVKVAAELKGLQDPIAVNTKADIDARAAVDLLRAAKELKNAQKDAQTKTKLIDAAKDPVEPRAYLIKTGGHVDRDTVRDFENDLRTVRTRAFLNAAGKLENQEALGRYVGVGAYNSINALALATAGASLVDRSVVDVLGIAGAAQVLARRLGSTLTADELATAKTAMESFHVDHYMALSNSALTKAKEWQELAADIEIPESAEGADGLALAQELNAMRREYTGKARSVLGTALGEMEANAALVVAMGQPKKDKLEVSLGSTPVEAAIRQVRAIGLDRGDYRIERVGNSTLLSVTGAGMDKLAAPVSRDDLERTRTALNIINGGDDEDGWLPEGLADRPDLATHVDPGVAPRLAKPFAPGTDAGKSIRDYIGGRAADGDAPADIMEGLLSEDVLGKVPSRGAFMDALSDVAPLYAADGKMIRAESHAKAFEKLADDFVQSNYGGELSPLHRQAVPIDDVSVDALHRALAAHPEGVSAFKAIGDLEPHDQRALRDVFTREYGKTDPAAAHLHEELTKLDSSEPAKEVEDMFGKGVNPEWRDWQGRRNDVAEKLNRATMSWDKYLSVMGSPANAYAAMQDVVKSNVVSKFAETYNTARPDKALKIGRSVIANDLNHLDALDPAKREKRLGEHRELVDRLRNRVGGKYAAGGVGDKIAATREAEEAASQAQISLFGDDAGADPAAPAVKQRELELGERHTIGHAAERQLSSMMPQVGAMFRAGQPVKLWRPDMSGPYVGRQRAVKLIEHNGHTMLGLGVGSGKTSISLAAFTHLKSKGKAKRGLFVVPSIVQGEFHGTALNIIKPGMQWHAQPGATRDERLAAYKDPKKAFSVVTHQAFRDDILHLAAGQEDSSPDKVAAKMEAMPGPERAKYIKGVMAAAGMDHDYMAVDEGHGLLNRKGKEDSRLAMVADAVSQNMPYYVNMTADPVKNDASEAFDVLRKMDPQRYSDRDAFIRKYGVDTPASKDELRREMARHFYTGQIDPGVKADRQKITVPLTEGQHDTVRALDAAAGKARTAQSQGKVDVEAMKVLSPRSFANVDAAHHSAVAANLQKSIGIIHSAAMQNAISGEGKTEALADIALKRKGKSGVVFTHSLDRVQEIAKRLGRDGHRVVTLTGADTAADKDRKKRAFQAGSHDIIVCSDAGAVGANLQKGKWLVQYDTPQTAMLHAQRNGRINRVGQTEDVELIDLLADHPAERRNLKRLAEKYDLRDVMTSPLDGLDDTGIAGYLKRAAAGEGEAAAPAAHHVDDQPEPTEADADDQASLF